MVKLTEQQENKLTARQLRLYNMIQKGYTLEEIANDTINANVGTIEKAIQSIEKKLKIKVL